MSPLSRRIQSLETHIGKPLFERLHRELCLTADGEWLVEQPTPNFEALAQALGDLRNSGAAFCARHQREGVPAKEGWTTALAASATRRR